MNQIVSTGARARPAPEPMLAGRKSSTELLLVKLFVVIPALALGAAVPFAWGRGLGWVDVGHGLTIAQRKTSDSSAKVFEFLVGVSVCST